MNHPRLLSLLYFEIASAHSHDLAERFEKDESISNLNFPGVTFDGEVLAADAGLRRKDTRVTCISRREIQEHVKRTPARLSFTSERQDAECPLES